MSRLVLTAIAAGCATLGMALSGCSSFGSSQPAPDKASLVREPYEYANLCNIGNAQWQATVPFSNGSSWDHTGDGTVYQPTSGAILRHPPTPTSKPGFVLDVLKTQNITDLTFSSRTAPPVAMLVTFAGKNGKTLRQWNAPLAANSAKTYTVTGMNYTIAPDTDEILPGEHIKTLKFCWGQRAH